MVCVNRPLEELHTALYTNSAFTTHDYVLMSVAYSNFSDMDTKHLRDVSNRGYLPEF
jgi:hypothetical protein